MSAYLSVIMQLNKRIRMCKAEYWQSAREVRFRIGIGRSLKLPLRDASIQWDQPLVESIRCPHNPFHHGFNERLVTSLLRGRLPHFGTRTVTQFTGAGLKKKSQKEFCIRKSKMREQNKVQAKWGKQLR